ncbi:MAG: class 1 fructose-bisphosphatase [Candidatus Alcyoniella australis]|nr:class 1 fructose-bisphosphatase [Candidatus Alcyoniella australis]
MQSQTMTRFIFENQRHFPEARGKLSGLLAQIELACKIISREVNKAGLVEVLGLTGSRNVQGEQVRKLDVYANEVMKHVLGSSGYLNSMASEEEESAVCVQAEHLRGDYVVSFDPLDGSSNIDANVSIGTIFSIHRSREEPGLEGGLLQPGRKQVAAGYVVYGSSTILVYTTGSGVHGFTLDPSMGEFLLSHENITIPASGKLYSVNEGNYPYWDDATREYIGYIKQMDRSTGRPYSLRYIGSLVADFHRTLLYGGIFLYPRDSKDPRKSSGKLRLLYEASPLAFIVEQAGGRASDGRRSILDIEPQSLHQRVPLIIGSAKEVDLYEKFIKQGVKTS